jgi:hypothetical protein
MRIPKKVARGMPSFEFIAVADSCQFMLCTTITQYDIMGTPEDARVITGGYIVKGEAVGYSNRIDGPAG